MRSSDDLVRAFLHVGRRRVTYLLGGRGPSVLVILPAIAPLGAGGRALVTALVEAHRVIVVAPPHDAESGRIAEWMGDVMDGLGLERLALVAAGAPGPAAVAGVARAPARIHRAVLLLDAETPAGQGGELASALDALGVPALVMHVPDATLLEPEQRRVLVRFLTEARP